MKEVKKQQRSKNFYLSIVHKIKQGKIPAQIKDELGISKQNLNYYIATLKRLGCIKNLAYGVWEYVKDYDPEEVKKTVVIGKNNRGGLKQDTVRGHGILAKLRIKKDLRNWDKREELLNKLNIPFEPYYVGGIKRGQRILFRNYKVALTDKSILFNLPESFIADNATKAKKDALFKVLSIIKGLERELRANFGEFGKYNIRFSRQHYALIKNALAQQYDKEGKKLECYSGKGLWLIIDNSYNLHETETVHPATAELDNLKVQNFFNSLKRDPITSTEIKENFKEVKEILTQTSKDQVATAQVLDQLNKNVIKITKDLFKK